MTDEIAIDNAIYFICGDGNFYRFDGTKFEALNNQPKSTGFPFDCTPDSAASEPPIRQRVSCAPHTGGFTMSTNFDAAINQARSSTDATDRATQLLQTIESALAAAGDDKAKRQEFASALSSNRAKLAAAFAGE